MPRTSLPDHLGEAFSVADAARLGVTRDRMRAKDLEQPFRGVRTRVVPPGAGIGSAPPSASSGVRHYETHRTAGFFERARAEEVARIRALAQRGVPGQFFSHRSAALLWGAPLPHRDRPELHLSVFAPARSPRVAGVIGHAFSRDRCTLVESDGIPLTSASSTWAALGGLSLSELIAAGDFFVRRWRAGHGRRNVGRPPHATVLELAEAVELGHWPGQAKLRRALTLIREDSWSPRESATRVALVLAGLPEPELNVDVHDGSGRFIGCVDLLYRRYRVAIEYQGEQHAESFAEDVERVERLRAEKWIVIQVTKALARNPRVLAVRVADALRERGWNGRPLA